MGFFNDLKDEMKSTSIFVLKGVLFASVMSACVIVGYNSKDEQHEIEQNDTNIRQPEQENIKVETNMNSEYATDLFSDTTKFHSYP